MNIVTSRTVSPGQRHDYIKSVGNHHRGHGPEIPITGCLSLSQLILHLTSLLANCTLFLSGTFDNPPSKAPKIRTAETSWLISAFLGLSSPPFGPFLAETTVQRVSKPWHGYFRYLSGYRSRHRAKRLRSLSSVREKSRSSRGQSHTTYEDTHSAFIEYGYKYLDVQ